MQSKRQISLWLSCGVAGWALACVGANWAVAQCQLTASDHAAYDRFGVQVAISGSVAVGGAPDHDHYGTDAGAAYVFRFNGSQWVQEQELAGSDIFNFARFGTTVAISGNFIVVGAPGDSENGSFAGAAYVFHY